MFLLSFKHSIYEQPKIFDYFGSPLNIARRKLEEYLIEKENINAILSQYPWYFAFDNVKECINNYFSLNIKGQGINKI
jgi:hypothetical protein